LKLLPLLPDDYYQCVVTSPPYWGLRDYGHKDQIGLEKTFDQWLARMVEVFEQVRRTLRPDGTLWLNIGDSYAANNGSKSDIQRQGFTGFQANNVGACRVSDFQIQPNRRPGNGFKSKDLIGQPWALAFALRAAGWYLRADIIWAKPNPMPESVTDRPTKAHEYLFLLTKSRKYYYDAQAIKEPCKDNEMANGFRGGSYTEGKPGPRQNVGNYKYHPSSGWDKGAGNHGTIHRNPRQADLAKGKSNSCVLLNNRQRAQRYDFKRKNDKDKNSPIAPGQRPKQPENKKHSTFDITSRNKRSVWEIASRAFHDAHFATFPEDLVKPCILAGTKRGDTVLDPFCGSGTTGKVACGLGRKFVGLELNPDYCEMARKRIMGPLFAEAI
jgi:DNA modification methylase